MGSSVGEVCECYPLGTVGYMVGWGTSTWSEEKNFPFTVEASSQKVYRVFFGRKNGILCTVIWCERTACSCTKNEDSKEKCRKCEGVGDCMVHIVIFFG